MLQKTARQFFLQRFTNYSTAIATQKRTKTRGQPLITCKRPEFNLYQGDHIPVDAKLESIPLASLAWKNRKSKGDFFILHPQVTLEELNAQNSEYWGSNFENFAFNDVLQQNIRDAAFKRATWIQEKVIPLVLDNQHVLIAAETGCGKTLAYLLPIIERLVKTKNRVKEREFNSPLLLILTPGRELADQIEAVARKMCQNLDLNVKSILGGNTKQMIMKPTFEDIDILIGTVGAISKLTTTGILRMNECRHVVLDEADTLLDLSFGNKMEHFLKKFGFHKNHLQDLSDKIVGTQLIMASATLPTNTDEMLQSVINPETIVQVESPNLHRLMSHVPQRFLRMNKSDRPLQLLSIVKSDLQKNRPVLIFSNKNETCDYVSIFLNNNGIDCVNFNGDMLAKLRIGRFEKFQNGEVNILSTTDVASRGLDTTKTMHVINFDFPLYVSDYIHRCGRTGRVGSEENCNITNFVSSAREIYLVNRIEHAARTGNVLPNVNANIGKIIQQRMEKNIDKLVN